jgi:hypothetical protein
MPLWNEPLATQAEIDALIVAVAAAQADADASCKKAANLSDVVSAASARNNIGSNQQALETRFGDLRGATAELRFLNWPFASTSGFGIRIVATLEGSLATGSAIIGISIDGVTTNPAALTIPLAGSAAGRSYSELFVAANSISGGASVRLAVSGTNTAAVGAAVTMTCIF